MKQDTKGLLAIIAAVILILGSIGGFMYLKFKVKRSINWNLQYSSHVQDEICKMVEAEHLTLYGAERCE